MEDKRKKPLTHLKMECMQPLIYTESKHHTRNYSFQVIKTVCSVNNGLEIFDRFQDQSYFQRAKTEKFYDETFKLFSD